jgi:hypothetical protein
VLAHGENTYGHEYAQAIKEYIDSGEYKQKTLTQMVWVHNAVKLADRIPELDWTYHRAVAPLPTKRPSALKSKKKHPRVTQKDYLEFARDNALTTRGLEKQIKDDKRTITQDHVADLPAETIAPEPEEKDEKRELPEGTTDWVCPAKLAADVTSEISKLRRMADDMVKKYNAPEAIREAIFKSLDEVISSVRAG